MIFVKFNTCIPEIILNFCEHLLNIIHTYNIFEIININFSSLKNYYFLNIIKKLLYSIKLY